MRSSASCPEIPPSILSISNRPTPAVAKRGRGKCFVGQDGAPLGVPHSLSLLKIVAPQRSIDSSTLTVNLEGVPRTRKDPVPVCCLALNGLGFPEDR
jgi:hypothetical protein